MHQVVMYGPDVLVRHRRRARRTAHLVHFLLVGQRLARATVLAFLLLELRLQTRTRRSLSVLVLILAHRQVRLQR